MSSTAPAPQCRARATSNVTVEVIDRRLEVLAQHTDDEAAREREWLKEQRAQLVARDA